MFSLFSTKKKACFHIPFTKRFVFKWFEIVSANTFSKYDFTKDFLRRPHRKLGPSTHSGPHNTYTDSKSILRWTPHQLSSHHSRLFSPSFQICPHIPSRKQFLRTTKETHMNYHGNLQHVHLSIYIHKHTHIVWQCSKTQKWQAYGNQRRWCLGVSLMISARSTLNTNKHQAFVHFVSVKDSLNYQLVVHVEPLQPRVLLAVLLLLALSHHIILLLRPLLVHLQQCIVLLLRYLSC